MKETRVLMGMPITVEIADQDASQSSIDKTFEYFRHIDETFSTYKTTSEITAINEHRLALEDASEEMRLIFALAEETKRETGGYFDLRAPAGTLDPSGIVKGWAIWQAAEMLKKEGNKNFYVDAGGDIQVCGTNSQGEPWAVGIKNPWNEKENVKVVYLRSEGIATSGTYIRGAHIYNPHDGNRAASELASVSVVGPNVYEADRFATAAFAMGEKAAEFLERLPGCEGYIIGNDGVATMTSGFEKYLQP